MSEKYDKIIAKKYKYNGDFVTVQYLQNLAKAKYNNDISELNLAKRLAYFGWNIENALKLKVDKISSNHYFYDNKQVSIKYLIKSAKEKYGLEITEGTLFNRIMKDKDIENAISMPLRTGQNRKQESEHDRLMRINGNKRWS